MTDKTEKNSGYVVTAPYITVRVTDQVGSDVVQGFYAGAVLPEDVNEDDLDKHERKGMVAKRGTPEADAATPFGQPVTFDDLGNPLTPAQAAEQERQRTERRRTRSGDGKTPGSEKPALASSRGDQKAATGNA